MGIYYYFSQFIQRIGKDVVQKTPPTNVEGVIFDLNGLIHPMAQKTYFYGEGATTVATPAYQAANSKSNDELMLSCFREIVTELNKVIVTLRPKQYLIIAVDGVVPLGKIAQQRKRQFMPPPTIPEDVKPPLPAVAGFSATVIKPGSPFMMALDNYLRAWINESLRPGATLWAGSKLQKSNPRKNLFPPVVVYSSHAVNGEGEHKAFYHLRELHRTFSIVQGDGKHVVYGKDSDLSMLCLLSPFNNMMLSRENLAENVDIDIFFNYVADRMGNKFEQEVLKRDFIVLSMILGNDFLPRVPSIEKLDDRIFVKYREMDKPLTFINSEKEEDSWDINFEALCEFFGELAEFEQDRLNEIASLELSGLVKYVKPNSVLMKNFDKDTGLDFVKYRSDWYFKAAELRNSMSLFPSDKITSTKEALNMMVDLYLSTIKWVFDYYNYGGQKVSWMFKYPFITAPLFVDLAGFDFNKTPLSVNSAEYSTMRGESMIAPVHQLLAVTPIKHLNKVIPKCSKILEILTNSESNLFKLLNVPQPVSLYLDGKRNEFEGIPIIKDIDLLFLKRILEEADAENRAEKASSVEVEEKRRQENLKRLEEGLGERKWWPDAKTIVQPKELRNIGGEKPVIVDIPEIIKNMRKQNGV